MVKSSRKGSSLNGVFLILIIVIIILVLWNSSSSVSNYVVLTRTFADTNKHRSCKALPAKAYDIIGVPNPSGLKMIVCDDGARFNASEDSEYCRNKICTAMIRPPEHNPRW